MHGKRRVVLLGPALIAGLVLGTSATSQASAVSGLGKTAAAATSQESTAVDTLIKCKKRYGKLCCKRHGRWNCTKLKKKKKKSTGSYDKYEKWGKGGGKYGKGGKYKGQYGSHVGPMKPGDRGPAGKKPSQGHGGQPPWFKLGPHPNTKQHGRSGR
ncbi:hypothetical protein [Streptosporangium sp. NPDC002721]|uniref:hypothetical protein n=1 Tax=Streptosporangium sp. NPDC002721 TaxID=3366188 RepID=UPI0036AB9371